MQEEHWTVGDVSEITRVSVRTLHHYDAIGLLRPSGRSEAGYRLYTPADLGRLHRVLTFRDLGFSLAEIARLLAAPPDAVQDALRLQAARLREQVAQAHARLETITSLLTSAHTSAYMGQGDSTMTKEDLKDLFGGFDHAEYGAEVQERWGDTDAYRQSAERTRRYTKADWEGVKAGLEDVNARYLALMDADHPPESEAARAAVAEHTAYFRRWFYDPTPDLMRGLAQMWVADERFTRNIDRSRPGLAAYQSAAVLAWGDRVLSE